MASLPAGSFNFSSLRAASASASNGASILGSGTKKACSATAQGGHSIFPGATLLARQASIVALSLACASLAYAAQPIAARQRQVAAAAGPTCTALACVVTAVGVRSRPTGGQVVSGTGSITESGDTTTIRQTSADLSLDWLSFNIGSQETVNFVQPSASAIAVNRIFGTSGSQILGHLDANGQVWLINPNGVVFGKGAQVNVGGLVASTLDVSSASPNGDTTSFGGNGTGSVVNQGAISAASGGYVALLGNHVSNEGMITAKLGTVALGAGTATTLTFSGNGLVKMQVNQSTLHTLAENGGLIQADGGTVVMNAGAKNALLASVVNNTGVIEARTVENHNGTIELLGGMTAGTVNVGGTLDASAPQGGNGGFIETSAAHVEVGNGAKVATRATRGKTGTWLIDPTDFTVAPTGGDLTGATLSSDLNSTNTTILSSNGASPVTGGGSGGNININDTVSWSANNTLTLTASNNVNVNANMSATGNTAGLVINPNTINGSQGASGTGAFNLNLGNSISLSGTSPILSIAGNAYTVINALGAPGSTTGTDLQGINGNLSGYYALGSNIDATASSTWNSGAGFTPLGNSTTNFTGSFNGLGNTVSNLTINLPSGSFVGMFGYAASGSVIQNVGLVGGSTSGYSVVGGLVAENQGSINNSYATGSVSGTRVIGGLVGNNDLGGAVGNSHATGDVNGAPGLSAFVEYVGGLVGYNSGSVTASYATGSVSAANAPIYVGGLVGFNGSSISNSYAMGIVNVAGGSQYVGGLVGGNGGLVSNSYATGNVSGDINTDDIGGLIGSNSSSGTVSDSYATGSVGVTSGSQAVGGLIGANFGMVTNSYAAGGVSGPRIVGGLAGFNSGTVTNSYSTGNVNGGDASYGVGGLVGFNEFGAVNNSYATGSVSGASGSEDIGGLVGNNIGTASTISNSYATGSVSGASGTQFGGLVGANQGTISNSYATGGISGNNGSEFGGLVGFNNSIVTNSYATGSVSGSTSLVGGLAGYNYGGTISNSYWNTDNNAAGIPGIGAGTTSGATGLTTAQMQTGSNFAGFNFTTIPGASGNNWVIVDADGTLNNAGGAAGATFPMLASEYATTIGNAHQLQLIAMNIGASYTLGQNISASATGNGSDVWGSSGFVPIGNSSNPFSGSFNGLGNAISNLSINLLGAKYVGLFGSTGTGSVIENVGLVGASLSGFEYVGGLVGYNNGGTVTSSYATGNVSGADYVGGLVGYSYNGTVSNSYAAGSASGSVYVGGLVGVNGFGTISNSYATGNVTGAGGSNDVGGLVGFNQGIVTNSYATSSVSGSANVGGLVGYNVGGATISNTYAAGTVSGASNSTYVGGLVGLNGQWVTNSYATGSVSAGSGSSFVGGLVGGSSGTVTNSYATGSVSTVSGGSVGGLVGLNYGDSISNSYATGSVSDASGSKLGGLVGANIAGGTITSSYATGGVSGSQYAGGLLGYNDGTVTDSYAIGAVSGAVNVGGLVGENAYGLISSSYATGTVSGASSSSYVGGLVGLNGNSISNSYATGSVSAGSGSNFVGGLVGGSSGPISNTYATGSVSGSTDVGGLVGLNYAAPISNSYATGSVSGSTSVGGLLGVNLAGGTVNNGFWDITTSGQSISAGGTGLTAAQMLTASSFTGWSIAKTGGSGDVWRIYEGNTFPLLISFLTPLTLADAADATVTYNGAAQSGANTAISGVLGVAAAGINAGSYNGYYSTQQGYDISGGNLTINPASLTLSGSRAYDGTTIAAGSILTATGVAGQTFSVLGGGDSSNLASKNIQSGSTLTTVMGLTLGGSSNGGLSSNYFPLSTAGSSISITPLALTGAAIAAGNSTYGASVTPGAVSFGNVIVGDAVSSSASIVNPLNSTSGHLNAGSYAQTATTLSGADAADYTFAGYTTPTNNYTVAQLALTGTAITAGNSTYGSSVTPGTVSFSNVISGDLVGAMASIASPSYSASNHLNSGNYAQSATTLGGADAADYSLAGYITPTKSYTVAKLALTGAAIAAGNSTYGSSITPGTVSFSNVISGDLVGAAASIVSPTYSTSNHLKTGGYAQTATTLTGADAGDYIFAGYTTPTNSFTVAQLALMVTGLTTTNRVYNGSSTDALGGAPAIAAISGDVISLSGTGSGSFADANVGTAKGVTVSGYTLKGSDAGNYLLVEPSALTANITQLASVSWVGGTTGNWSKATNWAGGAIPDFANVAAVTIPSGDTVTYDSGVPGATTLSTLTDSGNLVVAAGSLSTTGNLITGGYKQTGGTLSIGGSFGVQSTSAVSLGNISAGSANVGTTGGAITQLAATALYVTGTTSLSAKNASTSTYYPVTLANATNNFGGGVTSTGSNVNLADSGASGLLLGNTTATGTLTLSSTAGAITQALGAAIGAAGATSLTAENTSTSTYYPITLANVNNNFVGAVTSGGSNVNLVDSTSALKLGTTTATGTLTLDSSAGAITQVGGTAITATGATSLTAENGSTYYPITLANTGDNFRGAVTSVGSNVNLADSGASGLLLGTTTANGTLTLDSSGGPIAQVAGTAIAVTGASSLTADNGVSGAGDVKYNITLANCPFCVGAWNSFGGVVTANGLNVNLAENPSAEGVIWTLGNITATGTLTLSSAVGPITQSTGTAINATGATSLAAYYVSAGNYYFPITLTNTGNNFVGPVSSYAGSLSLLDSGASGLTLGGTTTIAGGLTNATGALTLTSQAGPITQAPGANVYATGATSLTASKGTTTYNIALTANDNYFGGAVSASGSNVSLSSNYSNGLPLGNVTTTGTLTVDGNYGPVTQAAGTTIKATGTSNFTAAELTYYYNFFCNCYQPEYINYYPISLANTGNKFGGAVTSFGSNISLLDSASSGLTLSSTTAYGTLTLGNTAGTITQVGGTPITATGATSLTASNGSANYAITLASTSNYFGSTVSATGSNVSLADYSSAGLTLGATTATGTLNVNSLNGPITQVSGTTLNATGATSLTAENGSTYYPITLANTGNNFAGAVTATGSNVNLLDSASALKLGNTIATGNFTADSLAGAITQVASTAVDVTGTSTLIANNGGTTYYAITLASTSNNFGGTITATGSAITLDDAAALTAVLDSTGASALTSAGALNVSGTVGTSLTTTTTGTSSATTFGATTVGTKLVVTSTGAVTETSSNILTVTGQGTTTVSNPNVTVNGVKGAKIP